MKVGDKVVCIKRYDYFEKKIGVIYRIDNMYPHPIIIEFSSHVLDKEHKILGAFQKSEIILLKNLKLKKFVNKEF